MESRWPRERETRLRGVQGPIGMGCESKDTCTAKLPGLFRVGDLFRAQLPGGFLLKRHVVRMASMDRERLLVGQGE